MQEWEIKHLCHLASHTKIELYIFKYTTQKHYCTATHNMGRGGGAYCQLESMGYVHYTWVHSKSL